MLQKHRVQLRFPYFRLLVLFGLVLVLVSMCVRVWVGAYSCKCICAAVCKSKRFYHSGLLYELIKDSRRSVVKL